MVFPRVMRWSRERGGLPNMLSIMGALRCRSFFPQQPLQPANAFHPMVTTMPEPFQGRSYLQTFFDVVRPGPFQRQADIVQLRIQPIQPHLLALAAEVRLACWANPRK